MPPSLRTKATITQFIFFFSFSPFFLHLSQIFLFFLFLEHINAVCMVQGEGMPKDVVVVSVRLVPEREEVHALVWSKQGDELMTIGWNEGPLSTSQTLKMVRDIIAERTEHKKVKVRIEIDASDELKRRLLQFESLDPQKPRCHSIGVVHCLEGQTSEDMFFQNREHSHCLRLFLFTFFLFFLKHPLVIL
jgi:hypothetical protein